MKTNKKMKTLAVIVTALLAVPLLTSCSGEGERICQGSTRHYLLVGGISISDIDEDKELAPQVADALAERAGGSCSSVSTALATNSPAADLELKTTASTPEQETANSREPFVAELTDNLRAELQDDFVDPLSTATASPGSPMLTTLEVIGREATAHQWGPVIIVWLGDGLIVERSPITNTPVAFGHGPVRQAVLDEWVPSLEGLRGSCVILVGAGAGSDLDDALITRAQDMLKRTLAKAGVGFVATRSADLPPGC